MREAINKHLTRWLVAVVFLCTSFNLGAIANAATTPASTTNTGNNGLEVSPTRTDMAINPGDSNTFQISIKNISSIPLTARVTLNDFESDNASGIPKLIINPNVHSAHSLRSFISGLSDIPLQSGESKNVRVAISVPAKAAPGGYYGAVRYSAIPINPSQNVGPSQVSLTASVASLVLVEINGPVNESLNFNSLKLLRHNQAQAVFFGKGPDQVAIKLTNPGNGFSQPIGSVIVNKGSKSVFTYQFNTNASGLHSTILPGSSRTFTDNIKNVSAFGQYKVTANIAYKQGSGAVTITQKFWVIPRLILYIFLGLLAIVLAGVGIWKLARRSSKK